MLYLDLKRFRQDYSLKQTELADIMDVSQSLVSRLENLYLDVNTIQYGKLCDRYGFDVVERYIIEKE